MGTKLLTGLIVFSALASAAGAQTIHAQPGQTITLGVADASVYYDESGGTFQVVATLAEGPESTPIRFMVSLYLGQALTISVPKQAGRKANQVRLMRTRDGLDVTYPAPATD